METENRTDSVLGTTSLTAPCAWNGTGRGEEGVLFRQARGIRECLALYRAPEEKPFLSPRKPLEESRGR